MIAVEPQAERHGKAVGDGPAVLHEEGAFDHPEPTGSRVRLETAPGPDPGRQIGRVTEREGPAAGVRPESVRMMRGDDPADLEPMGAGVEQQRAARTQRGACLVGRLVPRAADDDAP
ncbi:MAG: hypothetical protein K1X31_06820 [Gemmatimonadaceae bacterium]|nr:hypothetical protein [Gemmatimonadaceae bacterium]